MVKVPIVAVKIKGGYLLNTRWANYNRRGKIILEIKQFSGKDVLDFINHNEWEWQEKEKIKFEGKNKTNGIERILWFCPKCGAFRSIKNNKNYALCINCKHEFHIDKYDYLNNQRIDKILNSQVKALNDNFNKIKIIENAKLIVREKTQTK
ncbi:hypothetical protein Tmel_1351 [Thermosipho melanesiensis BI429]|uniref:Uncharacterized protein n=2 Tax=Thermosipho melanesiensis TaxID=46541 RepID=A6LMP9_THEM4|nr:hypothetical protein Tmel_1351 [Thermosipho melanesiensis BI429]